MSVFDLDEINPVFIFCAIFSIKSGTKKRPSLWGLNKKIKNILRQIKCCARIKQGKILTINKKTQKIKNGSKKVAALLKPN